MEMTFGDYMNNPMGKKNAVFSNREMYRQFYTDKLHKLLVRENGFIRYHLYKEKERYIIHLLIPSETVEKFYYDVIIEFVEPKKKTLLGEKTLDNYLVRFYSNDPAFVYTFAYAFSKNDMLFTDLNGKMSKLALKRPATENNPKSEVGYVKTLCFAYIFMKERGLFSKTHFVSADKYSKKALELVIVDADTKIHERQLAGEKIRHEKSKGKAQKSSNQQKMNSDDNNRGILSTVGNKVSKVSKTKRMSSTSKSGKITKSKKI